MQGFLRSRWLKSKGISGASGVSLRFHTMPLSTGFALDQMPLSVLFSVEDNTYWNAGDQKFHLPAGSFVIFRGDVEHAGAEYDKFSVRLHAYFDHNCISSPLRFTKDTLEKAIFYTRKMQA